MNKFEQAAPRAVRRRRSRTSAAISSASSLGGPIVAEPRRTSSRSVERTDTQEFFTVSTGKPEFYGAHEGTFEGGGFTNVYFVKGDVQLTPRQSAFVPLLAAGLDELLPGLRRRPTSSFGTDNSVPGFTYFAGHTWQLSNRVVNEFAVLYAESNQTTEPSRAVHAGRLLDRRSAARGYVVSELQLGREPGHVVRQRLRAVPRCAVDQRRRATSGRSAAASRSCRPAWSTPATPLGTWTFGTDQYLQPRRSGVQLQQPGQPDSVPGRRCRRSGPQNLSHTYEAYVQDEWRVGAEPDAEPRPALRPADEDLERGLRPVPLPAAAAVRRLRLARRRRTTSRRASAWPGTSRGDGRSVVRGGYGLVYGNMQNSLGDGEINAFQQYTVNIRNPPYPDPYQGRDPLSFVSTAPPNITILANDLENAESHTASARLSRSELGDRPGAARRRHLHEDGEVPDPRQHQHAGSGDRAAAAAGVGQHHPAAAVGRRLRLPGAAGAAREALLDAPPVHAVLHAVEAGQRLDRHERQRLRRDHRRLQSAARSGPGRRRPPSRARRERRVPAAVRRHARRGLGAAVVDAVQRAGRPRSEQRRLEHRLRARHDAQSGQPRSRSRAGQRVARAERPRPDRRPTRSTATATTASMCASARRSCSAARSGSS